MPALVALADAGHHIVAVYTQPDRPSGRGRKLVAGPVKQRAEALGLPIHQPENLRDTAVIEALKSHRADVMIVVAYGQLLTSEVLAIPAHGCLNIHGSLLPRWRGAAPIQRAILAGDPEIGICLMKMDKGLDTGPVLGCRAIPLSGSATAAFMHDELAVLGAGLLVELLDDWCDGKLAAQAQDDSQASYAAKLDKREARIDWALPAAEIQRKVCAFNPWPVAETLLDGERLRIWEAGFIDESGAGTWLASIVPDAVPGQVVSCTSDGVVIRCGEGLLQVSVLQLPGKKALGAAQFSHGFDITGKVLTSADSPTGGR